jgi:GT2 family glycosyltransferase
MQLDATVVICAYTEARWDDLQASVASVRRQNAPPREIVVVIDHNSDLLQRACAELFGVTVLENQETQGLSGARNTGVRAAQGSLIAFLDDDAVAEPDWLQLLVRACEDPNVLGCGGLIEPAWLDGAPAWFPEEFNWVVGCSYKGLPLTQCVVRNLIGGSMCIRREVFASVGGFRSEIGRVGKHPVGCEETELCLRALQRWPGRVFLYEPTSRIEHAVPGSRSRWSYFRARCYFEGRSKALVAHMAGARDGLSSEWTYTLFALPKGVARNVLQVFSRRDIHGCARAGAIVTGLIITAAGYVTGALQLSWRRGKARLRQTLISSSLRDQTA